MFTKELYFVVHTSFSFSIFITIVVIIYLGVQEKMKSLLGENAGIVEAYGSSEVMSVSIVWPHVQVGQGVYVG